MKYTKKNLAKLIDLSVKEAKIKAQEWFNRSCVVYGYSDSYTTVARDRIILYVKDDETEDENTIVILAGANDPTKFEK